MSILNRDADFAPLFIIGTHRSGTTWLHQLVVETGCFDYVSAYHVIKYKQLPKQPPEPKQAPAYLELQEAFKHFGTNKREIDDVPLSPDLPEEYGFILDNAGTGFSVTPRNLPILKELSCRINRGVPRPVVLKNPWDSANFVYLKKAIPKAKFLFIHRHPERVISSNLNAGRVVLKDRNAYLAMLSREYQRLFSGTPGQRIKLALQRFAMSRKFELGVKLTTKRIAASDVFFVDNIAKIPPDDYISLRYEDLCDRPTEVFGRVLEFLDLDSALANALQTGPKPRLGSVLPEVKWYSATIAQMAAPYMNMFGYQRDGIVEPLTAEATERAPA